jgi:hypothetical protein
MRIALAALAVLAAGSVFESAPAQADPYKWCAVYGGGRGGGGTNCYFMTLDQCRQAISGMGGFCTPNQFYDGRSTDSQPVRRKRRRSE